MRDDVAPDYSTIKREASLDESTGGSEIMWSKIGAEQRFHPLPDWARVTM